MIEWPLLKPFVIASAPTLVSLNPQILSSIIIFRAMNVSIVIVRAVGSVKSYPLFVHRVVRCGVRGRCAKPDVPLSVQLVGELVVNAAVRFIHSGSPHSCP